MRFNIGEKYVGKVYAIESYGAVLQFNDESTQLLHISHISDSYITDINTFFNIGDLVEVYAIPGKVKPVELTIRQSEVAKYESTDDFTFEELIDAYPPNERDIKYKDRFINGKSGNKNHNKKKKKK